MLAKNKWRACWRSDGLVIMERTVVPVGVGVPAEGDSVSLSSDNVIGRDDMS